MAYTGTGSSADPAIPSTITELYKIITDARSGNVNGNTSGPYYIKLTQDIDCADDPNYIGYAGAINCAGGSFATTVVKIYADTKKYIRGLTVKDSCFIHFYENFNGQGTTIENIDFIDCFFKPTGTESYGLYAFYSGTNSYAMLKNSTVSLSVYGYASGSTTYMCGLANYVAFNNCSIYIKNNASSGIMYSNYKIFYPMHNSSRSTTNNIFILDGFYIRSQGNSWDYPLIRFKNNNDCYNSFIFKNPIIQSPNNIFGMYLGAYNYIAFVNPSVASGVSAPVSINAFDSTATTIFATDSSAYGTVITKGSDSSGRWYWLTLDELKSEQKLLDIGFVP